MLKQFESSKVALVEECDLRDFIKLDNDRIKIVQIEKLYDGIHGPVFTIEYFEIVKETGLPN